MGNFGVGEMLFIGVIALLLFGPNRLPEVSRTVGRAVRELRQATNGLTQPLHSLKSEWAAMGDLHAHPAPVAPVAPNVPDALPTPAPPPVSTDGPGAPERPERGS